MAASACGNRNKAGRALFDRLVSEAVVDNVMQGDAAPAFDCCIEILDCTQRGNDDRHFPFRTGRHVLVEPVIGLVDDLVDRKRRCRLVRIVPVPCCQFFGDLVQPFVEHRLRTGIEGREASDDTRLALGDDQFGPRHDEQG